MNSRMLLFAVLVLGLALIAFTCQPKAVPERIGVYDSRAIAIAYANSPTFNTSAKMLSERMMAAKEKGDKKLVAAIEREGMLRQAMMHEQGFGKGSVIGMIALVKDSIAALAARENVVLVISKWEVAFSEKNVELVDLTGKVVEFFQPNERVRSMLQELPNHEPVENAYLIED